MTLQGMDTWHTALMAVTGVITIALMALEWRRTNRARLGWRLLALWVALAALLVLALPVRMPATSGVYADKVLVLTEGFNADTVQALYEPRTPVYAADSVSWINGRRWHAQWMPFPENWPQPGHTVHVVGSGLDPWQRNGITYVFHPAPVRNGLTQVHWNQEVTAGAALRVQGQFNSHQPLKVVLYGLNAPLDSSMVSPFTLSARPKHSGSAVYRLMTLQGKDTLSDDPLPVYVTGPDTLDVLLLAAVPDAENRFLKDWLGGHGSKVAMRTDISRGKAGQGLMNHNKTDESNTAQFSPYDLVVADAAALQALPMASLNALRQQVEQGMGLLVKADSGQNNGSFYNHDLTLEVLPAGEDIHLPQAAPLKDEQAVYIKPGQAQQPLVKDVKGRVFCSILAYGRGRIMFSTLHNTYSWQLASRQEDYDRLWTLLLHHLAREKPVATELAISPAFPLQHAPVQLWTYSNDVPPDTAFSFTHNRDIPFLWAAMQWPRRNGWQQGPGGHAWYAYARGDWEILRAHEKTAATAARAGGHTAAVLPTREGRPVLSIWPFLCFLVAAGFLWIERKL